MRSPLIALATAAATFALAQPAAAADGTYTSEAAFLLAASSTVLESFEALAGRSRSLASISTPLLTVVPGAAPVGVQTAPDSPDPGFGSAATGGTHYLSVYLAGQPQGTLEFDLAAPSNAFGLNLIDIGETAGTVSLRTDAGAYVNGLQLLSYPPLLGNGSVVFIGLTQAQPFSKVFLTVTGVDEAYGVDRVQLSAVPEPAAALTWLAGLPGLAGLVAVQRGRRQAG